MPAKTRPPMRAMGQFADEHAARLDPRIDFALSTRIAGAAAVAVRGALARRRRNAARRGGAGCARTAACAGQGADQVADLDGTPIGKPGTHERAVEQLRAMRGRSVVFQTAVAVVRASAGYVGTALVPVTVRFRELSDAEIEHYLRIERPYDCAGSAKCETLGIALLDAIESDDPTALVGLPLIRTSALLREAGIDALMPAAQSVS